MASNAQAGRKLPERSSGYNSSQLDAAASAFPGPNPNKHIANKYRRRLSSFEFETSAIRKHKGRDIDDHANALGRLLRFLDEI
jgi:hypothetical protein